MKPRKRKCKGCGEPFMPFNSLQKACSPTCALDVARADREKKARKEHQEAKKRIKPRSQWMREAQAAFNAFIRERDHDQPCISCEKPATWGGQWHASHYRPAGNCSPLRFDEANVHKACSECNNFKSGNLIEYRIRLIEKIGLAEVDRLEGVRTTKRWGIEELREIKDFYRAKVREMKRGAA